jgi:hypothetical protein
LFRKRILAAEKIGCAETDSVYRRGRSVAGAVLVRRLVLSGRFGCLRICHVRASVEEQPSRGKGDSRLTCIFSGFIVEIRHNSILPPQLFSKLDITVPLIEIFMWFLNTKIV